MLCESYTLILRRLGGDALQWTNQMKRFREHPITLVDAIASTAWKRTEMRRWTFDRHYSTMRCPLRRERFSPSSP